jgi:hypothetical protein
LELAVSRVIVGLLSYRSVCLDSTLYQTDRFVCGRRGPVSLALLLVFETAVRKDERLYLAPARCMRFVVVADLPMAPSA